jgi:hypothetical protein
MCRNQVLVDELAHEIELGLRRGWKADLDLGKADLDQHLEHAQLARAVHRLDQCLVAVAQVDAAPQGSLRQHRIGPAPVGETDRWKSAVLGVGLLQHFWVPSCDLRNQQPKTKRLVAGAYEPFDRLAQSYRRRPYWRCSSSASAMCFMNSMYHKIVGKRQQEITRRSFQCSPRSSGSSVDVLMTLACMPLALRQT